MILKDKLVGHTKALEEEYEPAFEAKAALALDNAAIQVDKQDRAVQTQVDTVPIMVAHPHEIMYEVELGADELDEGLDAPPISPLIPNNNWACSRKIPNTILQEYTWEPTI